LLNIFNDNYICALDISSSKIAAVVVKLKRKNIVEIFFESMPSQGVKKGLVVDSIELITCVEKALKNLKAKSGINIKYVYSNISGEDISLKHSRAIIPLADRGNKVITLSDIEKVNDQARILGSSLDEEIIDQIPYSYSIDSKNNISNPFGLYSHKLEVDLYLVLVKLSCAQTLTRVINQAGFEIKDLFFSPFATAKAIFNENSKQGINILCDIGSDITEILIFKDAMLKDIEILPFGGDDLTRHLSKELKIPFELAEDVKRSYASIQDPSRIEENKEILVKKDDIYKPIKQRDIIEIVTLKAKSFSDSIKDKIESKLSWHEIDNFFVCGRASLLEGFLEMLESNLSVPVKFGRIFNPQITSLISNNEFTVGQRYLNYVTCIGIILKAMDEEIPHFMSVVDSNLNPISRVIGKVKEVYQEYF